MRVYWRIETSVGQDRSITGKLFVNKALQVCKSLSFPQTNGSEGLRLTNSFGMRMILV